MNKIKILCTGDFAPIGKVEEKPGQKSQLQASEGIKELFEKHDLRITNLECPLTESKKKILKSGPHLKSHPLSIVTLKKLNIDVACLANNHIRDFGDDGVNDTIKVCKNNMINSVGAGENLEKASEPLIVNINNKKLAILNFAESEFNTAGKNHAGSNPDDIIHIWDSIHKVKQKSDFQIIIMHGGKEMHPFPTPTQLKLFRFIAEQGVDAVIGHHSHVIGGFEVYKNVPVIYSLGNFIFDEEGNKPEWFNGVLAGLNLDFDANSMQVDFYHTSFKNNELTLVEKISLEKALNDGSFIKTVDEESIEKAWGTMIKEQHLGMIKTVLNLSLISRGLLKLKLNRLGSNKKFLIPLSNRLKCDTHRKFTIDSIDYFINQKIEQ